MKAARALGYDTIAESIIETYRKTLNAMRTAEIVGNMTDTSVRHFLKKNGEPICHDKTRGARARIL
jgi:hypothetical protein